MKNDATSVRMRSGDHLGDSKMSKKARCPSNLSFQWMAIDRHGFLITKEQGHIWKSLPRIINLLPQDLVMIFQSLVMTSPHYLLQKTPGNNY